MAVAGPKSRATLQKIVDDLAMTDETVPYMAALEVSILGGIPARLFRLSFSGERAYELAVPADYGNMAARAVMQAGEEFGITPYGVEALSIMRIEKGHVAGPELNGQTTAQDLGLERMFKKRGDFIGRVLAQRPGMLDPARHALVGLRCKAQLRAGAHLTVNGNSQGWVTSATRSVVFGGWIALGMLRHGRGRMGETIRVESPLHGESIEAMIVNPHMYDPENARVRG